MQVLRERGGDMKKADILVESVLTEKGFW